MRFGRRYENRKEQRELSAAERRESRWNILEKTAVVIFFGMLFLGVYIWQEQHMPEELSAKLLQELRHGVTLIPAEGMYSKTPNYLLICVVNRHQVVQFQNVLRSFPDTFAYVSSVNETLGNFKHIA